MTILVSYPFSEILYSNIGPLSLLPSRLNSIYPKMPTLKPYKGDYYLWEYIPPIGASVVFLLFFLAATCYHSWKIWQTKARFCIAFCIGGICKISRTLPDFSASEEPILTDSHYQSNLLVTSSELSATTIPQT